MDGGNEYSIDNFLAKIEEQIKINCIPQNGDVEKALSFDGKTLSSLSLEDYSYYAYQLELYALHLQKQSNRMNTIKLWAKEQLNKIVAKEIDQYLDSYLPYEIKVKKITQNNSAADKYSNMILKAGGLLSELDFVSMKISHIAEKITDYRKTKEKIYAKV